MLWLYLFTPESHLSLASSSRISAWVPKPPLCDLETAYLSSLGFCCSPREYCSLICPSTLIGTFAFSPTQVKRYWPVCCRLPLALPLALCFSPPGPLSYYSISKTFLCLWSSSILCMSCSLLFNIHLAWWTQCAEPGWTCTSLSP